MSGNISFIQFSDIERHKDIEERKMNKKRTYVSWDNNSKITDINFSHLEEELSNKVHYYKSFLYKKYPNRDDKLEGGFFHLPKLASSGENEWLVKFSLDLLIFSDHTNFFEAHTNLLDYGCVHVVDEDKDYLRPCIKIKIKMLYGSLENLSELANKLETLVNEYYNIESVKYIQGFSKENQTI